MKKIIFIVTFLLVFCTPNAYAEDIDTIKATIVKQAIEMDLDPAIALSIAKTESNFRHEARSSYGAVGVFQLMPTTANRLGYNPYNLTENIKAGITYYKMMYKMFGSMELALAAYNAGPGNVKKYNNTIPPFAETKRFVAKITSDIERQKITPDPSVVLAQKQIESDAEIAKLDKTLTKADDVEIKEIDDAVEIKILDNNDLKLQIQNIMI